MASAFARYGARVGPVAALLATVVVSALAMLLYCYRFLARWLRNTRFTELIAEVSMPLFFVNGFMRSLFRLIAIYYKQWYVTLGAGLAFTVFSVAVAYGMLKLERRLFARAPQRDQRIELAG